MILAYVFLLLNLASAKDGAPTQLFQAKSTYLLEGRFLERSGRSTLTFLVMDEDVDVPIEVFIDDPKIAKLLPRKKAKVCVKTETSCSYDCKAALGKHAELLMPWYNLPTLTDQFKGGLPKPADSKDCP